MTTDRNPDEQDGPDCARRLAGSVVESLRTKLRLMIVADAIEVTGPGKGILQLSQRLDGLGIWNAIAGFVYDERSRAFEEAALTQGARFVELKGEKRRLPDALQLLRRRLEQDNVSIIQSHSFKPHLVTAMVRRRTRTPWIGFAHGWTAESSTTRLANVVERRLLRRVDHLCCTSQNIQRDFLPYIPDRVSVVPNAVDGREATMQISPLQVQWPEAAYGALKALYVGRLSHEKGVDIAIHAMGLARGMGREASLLIVGDGPERHRLEALCKELDLHRHVLFAGYRKDATSIMRSSDVLLLPSRSEGFPNVVLEAMSIGTPVVATSVGEVPSLIENGVTGWVVAPQEPESIAKAIVDFGALSQESRAEISARARSRVLSRFSVESRADIMLGIYAGVLRGAG